MDPENFFWCCRVNWPRTAFSKWTVQSLLIVDRTHSALVKAVCKKTKCMERKWPIKTFKYFMSNLKQKSFYQNKIQASIFAVEVRWPPMRLFFSSEATRGPTKPPLQLSTRAQSLRKNLNQDVEMRKLSSTWFDSDLWTHFLPIPLTTADLYLFRVNNFGLIINHFFH